MHSFSYARATDLSHALAELAQPDTSIVSGGTELLNWMRLGIAKPRKVVDIGRLEGMDSIRIEHDSLIIGALATLNEVGEHPLVVQHAAVLSQACLKAASPQVRNRATIGGNVMQKTRCPYFRGEAPLSWGCNKRQPGSGCAARDGMNERHAIFGWTDACVAVQPADPLVALVCLDATVEVVGPQGRRALRMHGFHLTQEEAAAETNEAATHETRLGFDEVIIGYRVHLTTGTRSAYVKVRERQSYEYALVSAAATVMVSEGLIETARIALGSVAQRPWRLEEAEADLKGKPLTHDALWPIVDASMRLARPLTHNKYKVDMARNAAVRALLSAGAMS